MAQQLILAAAKRRAKLDMAESSGFLQNRRRKKLDAKQGALRQALAEQKERLGQLFDLWDEDGNGEIDEKEFRRAIRMLGLKPSPADFVSFLAECDGDGSGNISLQELQELLENTPPPEPPPPPPPKPLPIRLCFKVYELLTTNIVQTALYLVFVLQFMSLLDCLRMKEEYFLDKALADTFIDNHYDAQMNTSKKMRRVPDVWEWGSQVLLPGLLGNNGPACGDVGRSGAFRSSTSGSGASDLLGFKGGCNDDVWPDGDGLFSLRHANAWSVHEVAKRFDSMDCALLRMPYRIPTTFPPSCCSC